jgi:glutamate N-acetyltransferase/amino-acid N-acetyltransferase
LRFHDTPRFPRGFRCASRHIGLKPDAKDLALFASDVDAAAAALFTKNHFPGAPVILGRETIKRGVLRGIVANSKVSNVGTGEEGVRNARRMAAAAARELGTTAERMLVSSTGVIGVPLPIDKIERGVQGIAADLQDDPLVGAEGIMTTDTHPKALSASVGDATITWIAKGSGMIEPNMATMLAYIFTDAAIAAPALDALLRAAAHVSFNMMLARDGEGATRLLRVAVRGARDEADARRMAKNVVNSPLIKTMVHGADPNVGRILMAIGKCQQCTIAPDRTSASVNGFEVVVRGARVSFDDAMVRAALSTHTIDLVVDLGVGMATATAYGCDLSRGYIEENAAYYSS